jgi:retron-type reverse transcriptase
MAIRSADVFARHFSEESLQEIIDLHLKDGVARGVDGTGYERFLSIRDQEVQLIAQRASEGRYKFSPYRQKLILKNAISPPRQVSIPTLRDRVALRALNNCLTEIFPDCRPQHAHPVISSVLNSVREMTDADCFIKLDVRSFYDEVNHSILMRNVRQRIRCANPLSLIEGAITTPTGTTVATRAKNSIGIPQGLSISNLLSSIYLKSIDEKYGSMLGLKYHRYVDDILCIAPASEAEDISRELIKRLKTKKKLRCHPLGSGKSMISDATNDITYLGYLVSKMKISVRSATEKN